MRERERERKKERERERERERDCSTPWSRPAEGIFFLGVNIGSGSSPVSFGREYRSRFCLCTHAFHRMNSKEGWVPTTETNPTCTVKGSLSSCPSSSFVALIIFCCLLFFRFLSSSSSSFSSSPPPPPSSSSPPPPSSSSSLFSPYSCSSSSSLSSSSSSSSSTFSCLSSSSSSFSSSSSSSSHSDLPYYSQHQDRTVGTLWNEVLVKLPIFFRGLHIWPALLHADLWSGNVAETKDGPGM